MSCPRLWGRRGGQWQKPLTYSSETHLGCVTTPVSEVLVLRTQVQGRTGNNRSTGAHFSDTEGHGAKGVDFVRISYPNRIPTKLLIYSFRYLSWVLSQVSTLRELFPRSKKSKEYPKTRYV